MPDIYFYCYDVDIPSGGIKVLYQHVDILNKHDFTAFILHEKKGFRCTWFENRTPVISMSEVKIQPADYLVIPEGCFTDFAKATEDFKKVVFNQNCYCTFSSGYAFDKKELATPYRDKNLIAALVVSEDNKQYLSYVFPDLNVVRIRNAIDPQVFLYQEHKKPLIAFMIRKNIPDSLQVINILKFRKAIDDFDIVPVHDKTEKEVAQILRESLIFLSFGYPEGFSLPPAEAMACGCIVIGYHGMGGKEFFNPEFSYPVPTGDIISFAQTVEKVLELYRHDKNILKEKGRLASQYIYDHYSKAQQEKEVIQFWKSIIGNPAKSNVKNISNMNMNDAIQLAQKYLQTGDLQNAEHVLAEIVKKRPDNVAALNLLGLLYYQHKEYDSAITVMKNVIGLDPHNFHAYFIIGHSLQEKGQPDESVVYYQEALKLNPGIADIHYNLGILFNYKGDLNEAIINFRKAVLLNPKFYQAYTHLGLALQEKGESDEAIKVFQNALELAPTNVIAYYGLGEALRDKGDLEESANTYRKALELDHSNDVAYCYLGVTLLDQGKPNDAEFCFKRALEANPDDLKAYHALLLTMNYNPMYSPETIYSAHLQFAKKIEEAPAFTYSSHPKECDHNRPLKIGYISPDFRTHSVGFFIEPVLTSHNHDHFKIYCYSNLLFEDDMTKHMRHYADRWRNITRMSDEEVAELIRKDGIDILVDLAGHTANNRLLVFARKPAPVQVSWIGYPNTTGLSAIDYKIVDNYTDPPGMTEHLYTEKLERLPDSFLCYMPYEMSPEVKELPALGSGHITFGSFNDFSKVSPDALKLWVEILKKVPNSRLIIKARGLTDSVTCKSTIDIFTGEGIESDRIELLPYDRLIRDHLGKYNRVDIGLDTFPYNGTTTMCEALWMGVPVITLTGKTHVSRVGTSILSNLGLHELIAKTGEDYVRIAVNFSHDMIKLQSVRKDLRNMMIHSPLTNAKSFIVHLEESYRKMWQIWCQSD